MEFEPTPIAGAYQIRLSPMADERGVFSRLFCAGELSAIGHSKSIVQINHSVNKVKGTVRGLHYQHPPDAEIKMIRCLQGKVYDVILDIRKGSSTFLKWHAVELSPESFNMVYIPEGCAHGFQTLEDSSSLLYFHTAFYNKQNESGVRHDDPAVGIQWPLRVVNVSEKDMKYPPIDLRFDGI